jgi:CNT family concentrative nucleoside transporter
MGRFTGILGLLTILGLAYAFSTNRRAIRLKTVAWGLGLQFVFAIFVLRIDAGRLAFQKAGDAVTTLLSYAYAGSHFVFGDLAKPGSQLGYFAFGVLPTVIFIAAFFAVLYHFGVMQIIIRIFAWVMTRVMGASGAESLNVAASIFMGQTEAPLTIRPFLPDLTRSELMTVMTSGMAHVSGGIMAAYIAFGIDPKHLLSAVIMTAPGTLLMAKMLVPETEQAKTAGKVVMSAEEEKTEKEENLLGAIARGTTDGLHLALNIAAMLISFLALIALANGIFGGIHNYAGTGIRIRTRSGGVGDRNPGARLPGGGQSARHTNGSERTRRFLHPWADQGFTRSSFGHHRNVRAVRVRELELNRHSDWGHWRPGSE